MHKKCAQGRGESKRVDERNTHCNRHRESELLVEHSGRTSHKAHRDEHCHKHECSRDKGSGELVHCVDCRLVWRLIAYVKLGLDSLHHDNGVVHHSTDYKHQCKQGDHIQTEARHHKEGESSEQRNDDRQRRDNGRTEAVKEEIYDQNHKEDSLKQCHKHILDRLIQEVLGTHQVDDLQALRQILADLLHHLVDLHDDFVGI